MVKKKGVPASPKTKHLQTPNLWQSAPFIHVNLREPWNPESSLLQESLKSGPDSGLA
ncbi:MAG TPA: hypothetical protein P5222_08585 [Candidatus Cloacimonadota bacterium]|nr:hypothetical protein [Candidatus Cloacimonadota bacterium]